MEGDINQNLQVLKKKWRHNNTSKKRDDSKLAKIKRKKNYLLTLGTSYLSRWMIPNKPTSNPKYPRNDYAPDEYKPKYKPN